MKIAVGFAFAFASMICAAPAGAETITYSYDAKGRLVRVVKAGGPTNGTVTTYDHDKADNRKSVKTVGAPR